MLDKLMISACTHRIILWPGNTISQGNPFFLWDIPSLRFRLHCFSFIPAKIREEEIPTCKGKFQYYIHNRLLLFLVLHQGEQQRDLWIIPCILMWFLEQQCLWGDLWHLCQTHCFRGVLVEDTCWFTGSSLLIPKDNRFYLEGFLLPLFIDYFRSGTLLCSVVLYCCL